MFKKMTLVQIAKDGPGSSVNAWNWVDILPVEDEKEGSWLRLVARPLELELEKEMSIEKHWKQMYLVYELFCRRYSYPWTKFPLL
jgi:hypothetical protein